MQVCAMLLIVCLAPPSLSNAQVFKPHNFADAFRQGMVACARPGAVATKKSFQALHQAQNVLRKDISLWSMLALEQRRTIISNLNGLTRLSIACESGTLAAAFEPQLFEKLHRDILGNSLEADYARYLEAVLPALVASRNLSAVNTIVKQLKKATKVRADTLATVFSALGHELFALEEYQRAEDAFQDALAADLSTATRAGASTMLMARYISQSRHEMIRGLALKLTSLENTSGKEKALALQSKRVSKQTSQVASDREWVSLVKTSQPRL
jgi:hypothetical protein